MFYTLDVSGVGYVSGANYRHIDRSFYYLYEGWNFNSGNYLFTTDTK